MAKTNKLSARKKDERVAAYIFTIPAIALLVAFLVVPMIYTVYYSVFKYQVMRPNDITFIGLDNYTKLFKDDHRRAGTVCARPRAGTFGLQAIQRRFCFPHHVLQPAADFHGRHLCTVDGFV